MSEKRELKLENEIMTCDICDGYRDYLRSEGGVPLSDMDPNEPGYMQPAKEVWDRMNEDGCEPVFENSEWKTACDFYDEAEAEEEENEDLGECGCKGCQAS